MNKGGFSWKRAIGISGAKSRFSRRTGIPLTAGGRQRKVGRMVTGGGCLLQIVAILGVFLVVAAATSFGARHLVGAGLRLVQEVALRG